MATKSYELMFIVNPELSEDETKALIERIQSYIEETGGEVFDMNHWGMRRLAYPIRNHREGRYYLTHFTMPSEHINDVKRRMLLIEDVLRELITQFEGELVMPKPSLDPIDPMPDLETVPDILSETLDVLEEVGLGG